MDLVFSSNIKKNLLHWRYFSKKVFLMQLPFQSSTVYFLSLLPKTSNSKRKNPPGSKNLRRILQSEFSNSTILQSPRSPQLLFSEIVSKDRGKFLEEMKEVCKVFPSAAGCDPIVVTDSRLSEQMMC